MIVRTVICAFAVMQLTTAATSPTQPYAGQDSRAIKALSAEEIEAYRAGKGMGFAKAAELNGYPGPAHVLELASQLNLTAEQRAATQAVFASMQSEARALGGKVIEQERQLDQLFASGTMTPERLSNSLDQIASLQGKLRATHLRAHLEQARILTGEQRAHYAQLRGYASAGDHAHDHHMSH
jgi:Spy/CpxP family protein refolding chaperone